MTDTRVERLKMAILQGLHDAEKFDNSTEQEKATFFANAIVTMFDILTDKPPRILGASERNRT